MREQDRVFARTGNGRGSRRTFITMAGAAAAASVLPFGRVKAARSPNEAIRVGMIATGTMGRAHMYSLAQRNACDIVALCDVFKPRYEEVAPNIETITGKMPDCYQDFRYVLDRDDIDAVFVSTPDHWHPLITIMACQAGKDVYVEKPASPTVVEGRRMVDTARRYGRVVQLGTQQRSMEVFQRVVDLIRAGVIGQVTTASAWVGVNEWGPGETPQDPPEGLDWDLWLGPAPWVPYAPERHFGFMGWHDYCRGGQLTNWGIHLLDIVQWGIGQDKPLSVQALGGSYRHHAGADNYETVEALLEYPGCTVTWEQRHTPAHEKRGYGIQFHGTRGRIILDRGSFKVYPETLGIPEFVGPPEHSWANAAHHEDFFEAMRTRRRPAADIEQGHRSTVAALLPGIALKLRRRLEWDGDGECFVGDEEANRHLTRAYRAPWRLP